MHTQGPRQTEPGARGEREGQRQTSDTNAKSDRGKSWPRTGISGAYFENDWTRFRVSCPRLYFTLLATLLALSIGITPVIAVVRDARSFSISSPLAIRRSLPLTFSFDIGVPAFAWTMGTPGEVPEVFNLEILESEITIPSTQKRDSNFGISCVRFIFTSCIPLSTKD